MLIFSHREDELIPNMEAGCDYSISFLPSQMNSNFVAEQLLDCWAKTKHIKPFGGGLLVLEKSQWE